MAVEDKLTNADDDVGADFVKIIVLLISFIRTLLVVDGVVSPSRVS